LGQNVSVLAQKYEVTKDMNPTPESGTVSPLDTNDSAKSKLLGHLISKSNTSVEQRSYKPILRTSRASETKRAQSPGVRWREYNLVASPSSIHNPIKVPRLESPEVHVDACHHQCELSTNVCSQAKTDDHGHNLCEDIQEVFVPVKENSIVRQKVPPKKSRWLVSIVLIIVVTLVTTICHRTPFTDETKALFIASYTRAQNRLYNDLQISYNQLIHLHPIKVINDQASVSEDFKQLLRSPWQYHIHSKKLNFQHIKTIHPIKKESAQLSIFNNDGESVEVEHTTNEGSRKGLFGIKKILHLSISAIGKILFFSSSSMIVVLIMRSLGVPI
jgi:hypothetical protein